MLECHARIPRENRKFLANGCEPWDGAYHSRLPWRDRATKSCRDSSPWAPGNRCYPAFVDSGLTQSTRFLYHPANSVNALKEEPAMTEQQTDEHKKLEARQRDFGERFAAWWNRGAEKAQQGQTTPTAAETAKRDAA